MSGRLGTNPPQPHKTISCQQLLQDNVTYSGWLRKRSKLHKSFKFAVKVIPWGNNYTVLSKGCMYVFSSDTAKKPSSAFSLYGYNGVMRAGEILQHDAPWAFKLVTVDSDDERLRYFSTPSEREQKIWMAAVKRQMMFANGKGARISNRSNSVNDESASFDDIEDKVYDTTSVISIGETDDLDEEDYNEIDDWEHGSPQDNRSSRPLPPVPGGRREPALLPPVSPGNRRVPVFPPGQPDPPQRAAAPPPTERRKPPELPQHSPEEDEGEQTQYLDKERGQEESPEDLNRQASTAMSGTVNALKEKFSNNNDRPKLVPKPNMVGKIKVMQNGPVGGIKMQTPVQRQISEDAPSQQPFRKAAPLPTAPKPKTHQRMTQDREVPDGTDNPNDGYLGEILWYGKDKEEANRILNDIKEDGVFLVRQSDTNDKVLVVFAEGGTRKYKIVQAEDKYYITSDEQFNSLKEMLDHYHKEYLPRRSTCLLKPYSQCK